MTGNKSIGQLLAAMSGQSPHAADMTRRRFIANAATFGLSAAAAAALTEGFAMPALAAVDEAALPKVTAVPDRLKGSGVVRYCSYGGSLQDAQRQAFLKPFEALTGIKVIESEGSDATRVQAMVDTGNIEWDVYEDDGAAVLNLAKKGDYYDVVDYSLVDPAGDIFPEVKKKLYFDMLPYAQVIAYRKDAFGGKVPTAPKDLWDTTAFPGPRSMQTGSDGLNPDLEQAVLAAGVPRDKVYPIDLDKAYASLARIKPSVVKWWQAGAIPAQLLNDDEVVMATAWNGRIDAIQNAGAPVDILWKDQLLRSDCWAFPKGAANRENAYKLAAFMALPESQARLSMLITYGFINKKAEALIPPARLKVLPSYSEHRDELIPYNTQWWADNLDPVTERWNKFILG